MIAAPIYAGLTRKLAVTAAAVALAGLYQTLRVADRTVITLVLQVPATTHLVPDQRTVPLASRSQALAPAQLAPAAPATPMGRRPIATTPVTPTVTRPTIAPPPSAPPPTVRPPAPGAYAYRYTVDNSSSDGTITTGPVRSVGTGRTEETEIERVAGTTRERNVDWSTAAVTIAESDYGTGACRWTPALSMFQIPFHPGQQWSARSTCPFTTSDRVSGTLTENEQAKVDGYVRTTVGGRPVDAWVLERHTILTETAGNTTITTESQSTEMFAPQYGLVVWEDGRTATPNRDGTTTTSSSTIELRDVQPT